MIWICVFSFFKLVLHETCLSYLLFVNGLQWLFAVNNWNYIYLKIMADYIKK